MVRPPMHDGDNLNLTLPSTLIPYYYIAFRPPVTEARLGVQREPAEMIASGANHSVALTRSSKVYAWGSDEFGQCGGGGEGGEVGGLVLTPQEVQLPPHAGRIVSVSAGYAHTVLRDDRGAVYVMGQNESGQLGLGGGSFKNPVDVRSLIVSPFTKDSKTK
jgi:alpha-tubulin suppressor-like RCC1 family protein